jgi:hypothetical protein
MDTTPKRTRVHGICSAVGYRIGAKIRSRKSLQEITEDQVEEDGERQENLRC